MARVDIFERSALHRVRRYPKTASVDASYGDWLTIVSGYAKRATSSSANLLGVAAEDWTNDATNDYVSVSMDEFGLWEMDSAVTLVQATHVGNAYDLTDHDTFNPSANTYKVLTVHGITPDGRGLVQVNNHFGTVGHV